MSMLQLLDGNGYIDSGEIIFDGVDLTKLSRQGDVQGSVGNEISVIFQEPMTSLNPVFTVERQISEPFMVHRGMNKKEAAAEAVEMLAAMSRSRIRRLSPSSIRTSFPAACVSA